MSIIDTLITDRTAEHVARLLALEKKGWDNLTEAERIEYRLGNELEQLYDSQGDALLDKDGEPLYVRDRVQRGAYNANDLNRVEAAVSYLAGRISNENMKAYAAGLDVAWDRNYDPAWAAANFSPEVKTDWTETDFPTASAMDRYLRNVTAIRRAVPAEYPSLPKSIAGLDYAGANAIEAVLKIADGVITNYEAEMSPVLARAAQSFVPCGVAQCGVIW